MGDTFSLLLLVLVVVEVALLWVLAQALIATDKQLAYLNGHKTQWLTQLRGLQKQLTQARLMTEQTLVQLLPVTRVLDGVLMAGTVSRVARQQLKSRQTSGNNAS